MTKIHFLNVGHGDCTIIEHPSGRITMIDINNGDRLDDDSRSELASSYGISQFNYILDLATARATGQSFRKTVLAAKGYKVDVTNPVEYYKAHFGTKSIFRYIQTHADLDHMRGLKALQQEGIQIMNFWDTQHNKSVEAFQDDDEEHWTEYKRLRLMTESPKNHFKFQGESGKFWNSLDGDGLHILSPTPELRDTANAAGNINAHSYVLWLEYAGRKVLFGGDATDGIWQSLFDKYGKNLKCDILKAAHHGRDSGYHQEAVKAMSPQYAIISVGTKPETDASNKYRQYCQNVWSTRWKGNVVVTINPDGNGSVVPQY